MSKWKPLVVSIEEQRKHITERGGYKKKQLAKWGVKWPPRSGWPEKLARGLDPNN